MFNLKDNIAVASFVLLSCLSRQTFASALNIPILTTYQNTLSVKTNNSHLKDVAANETMSCEEVVVSAHPNYAPFHWEENGEIVGASIAITGQILDEMGIAWRTEYVGPWKRVLQRAYSGKVDLIPALKRTAEREEFISFTNTIFYSNPVAVYRKNDIDAIALDSLDALDGLIGSVNAGDSHGKTIDSFLSVQDVAQIKGIKENFEMLKMGRTDYFVIGKHTAQSFLNSNALTDEFKIVLELSNAVVHHGFSKRSPCAYLMPEFDSRMARKIEDGDVQFAIEHYKSIWLERKLLDE